MHGRRRARGGRQTTTRRNKRSNDTRNHHNRGKKDTMILRSPQETDRVEVTLRWPVASLLTNSGNATVARRWTTNALYDIDPTFGSTSLPGFAEWIAFYKWNLVTVYSYQVTFVNNEAFPVVVYITNSTSDPGTTGTNYYEYSTAKFGKQRMLSAKGGSDRVSIKGRVPISALVGMDITKDNSFRGTSTANPTSLVYLGVGYNALGNDFTAAGVTFQLVISVRAAFFLRNPLTT